MKPSIWRNGARMLLGWGLSAAALGLLLLALAVTSGRADSALSSPTATTTPNPRCGVAGAKPRHLQALNLSLGEPEPGGYVWDHVTDGNGVQMVRPCKYYDTIDQPWEWHPHCFDTSKLAIWDPTADTITNDNEIDFTRWVSNHRGLTWIIGNEPDLQAQDNLSHAMYVTMYVYFSDTIRGVDPTAALAIGGIAQVDGYLWAEEVLSRYRAVYSAEMPIDVWTIHHYNIDDYNVATVQNSINAWIKWITMTRPGISIWLTEWGKGNGWADPDLRNNRILDDAQYPALASLMYAWADWMEKEGKIDRWFWFIAEMGDWGKDAEFDITGWLFQETTDFITGTVDSTTTRALRDATLPPPIHHDDWVGAALYVDKGDQRQQVIGYDRDNGILTVTEPFSPFLQTGDVYRLLQSSYDPLVPNFLGQTYMFFCNPGLFPYRVYLPLIFKGYTPGSLTARAGLFVSPLSTPAAFDSPLPTPTPFVSPLPTPTPPPGRVLIDDFEYPDSPTNHGWYVLAPGGALSTLNYKSDSHELFPHGPDGFHHNFAFTYPGDPASGQHLATAYPFLSFEVSDTDNWWAAADVVGSDGQAYRLLYMFQFGPPSVYPQDGLTVIQYNIGEGKPAYFGRNLDTDLSQVTPGVHLEHVQRLTFYGPLFLDDVMLRESPFPGDLTPPITTLHVQGARGRGDWYTSHAVISISAADEIGGSGVGVTFGQFDRMGWNEDHSHYSVITAEGRHLLEGYAVDRAGNVEQVKSAAFGIDRTRPAVRIISPLAITYTQGVTFTVAYTASDAVSGIQTITATLDGAATSQGQVIDTLALAPGPHTLAVTATDAAGWTASASRVFTVEVTLPGLVALKHWLYARGEIYGPGVGGLVTSLDAKLDKAQRAIEKGDVKGAVQRLQAFIAEVQAQAGKHITPQAAKRLVEVAQSIMARWPMAGRQV